ncbi:class F sortase [Streptomyces sp. NPDC005551]|uniref:class F sortase n=1 Tax=Streptomyces sp. NPDC005551 TaxID=3364725 RepID=UPI0036A6311E
MVRRRRRRPWYRTRAYRLARTAVLTVVLVTAGIQCAQDDEPAEPAAVGAAGHGGAEASPRPAPAVPDARGAPRPRPDQSARQTRRPPAPRPAPTRTRPPTPAPTPRRTLTPRPAPPPRPLPRSRPTALDIRYLRLHAPVMDLRLDRRGQLTTPPVDNPKLVGWYAGGPSPGEPGTSVVVGHRDTRTGAAVFAGLAALRPGKVVEARRADGRTAVFTVDEVRTYEKSRFPDRKVYGPSRRPELRLITCGGTYSAKTGYASNVVVFAHLTATR